MRPTLLLATVFLLAPRAAHPQWAAQASGTDAELRGLSVVSARVAWVSGTRGRFARTTDGGATWRADSIAGASSLDLRAIHALDARTAWALSAGPAEEGQARIFRTTDGGARWTLQWSTEQPGVFLDAIAFWDARHGVAMSDPVDGRFFVLTTDDGGATWTRVPAERLPPALTGEAAFAASGSCLTLHGARSVWIGTGGGATARVFRSTDRGRSWTVAETPVVAGDASAGIFSLDFRDAMHGVAVGGDYRKPRAASDNVAVTRDGGQSWTKATGPLPAGYMSAVAFVPGAPGPTLVAVGLAGTARSVDGGESWAMVDSIAYNSVRFVAPRDGGFAAGPNGRLARWRGEVRSPTSGRHAQREADGGAAGGSAPRMWAAQISPTEIRLTWDHTPGVARYTVHCATGAAAPPRPMGAVSAPATAANAVATLPRRLTYVVPIRDATAPHRCTLQAADARGRKSAKVAFNPVVPVAKGTGVRRSVPSVVAATASGPGEITVTWGAVPSATAYFVGRGARQGGFQTLCELCPATTTYVDRAVEPDVQYTYMVGAITAEGALPRTSSNAVTLLEGGEGPSTGPNPVVRGPSRVPPTRADPSTATDSSRRPVADARVAATRGGTGTTGAVPYRAPSNAKAVATSATAVSLSWIPATGVDRCLIQRSTNGGAFTALRTLASGISSYVDAATNVPTLAPRYRIACGDAKGSLQPPVAFPSPVWGARGRAP